MPKTYERVERYMGTSGSGFASFEKKMRDEGLSDACIGAFENSYNMLVRCGDDPRVLARR